MNEEQMKKLVIEALGRECACEAEGHGKPCPDNEVWHTWRKRLKRRGVPSFCVDLAAAFVGRDGHDQAGTFKINLRDHLQRNQMIQEAAGLGYHVTTDVADPPATFRAVVTPSAAAAGLGPERDFYIMWLRHARGE